MQDFLTDGMILQRGGWMLTLTHRACTVEHTHPHHVQAVNGVTGNAVNAMLQGGTGTGMGNSAGNGGVDHEQLRALQMVRATSLLTLVVMATPPVWLLVWYGMVWYESPPC